MYAHDTSAHLFQYICDYFQALPHEVMHAQLDITLYLAVCQVINLLILGFKLLLCYVQLYIQLLIIVELTQDVGVVCLTLADGWVKGDDHQSLGNIGLEQHKQPDNRVVLYSVVLSLQGKHHR